MGHVGKDSRKRIVMTKRREDKGGAACVLYCIIVFTSFGKKKVHHLQERNGSR